MKELFNKLAVRIQNPKVIVAVVSGVLLILANTGVVTVEHANHVSDILNTFLSVFVGLGVFGNPESHVTLDKNAVVQEVMQAVLGQSPVQTAPVQTASVTVQATPPPVQTAPVQP